ncbi:hypothetical protein ACFWIA_07920 [Streptomyces sp. NPDC127068]|uniref:hypothetical protein n=1 Tax=Streptomyces sp. NPDC127068 TaxID=3347127 RepID=UPI00364B58BC
MLDCRESDWVQTRVLPNFKTRLMLVVIAVLFSLVVALATAFLFYAAKGSPLTALTVGGGAFVATMTLFLGVFALLLL